MHWLNEPASWQRTDDVLRVTVDPGTDFWRATGYGYIHDNGHVYGDRLPGDVDVSVRMRGTFAHQYDQAGIMLRADEQTWLKTGVEFFEGRLRLSTVLTLGWSSWIVADLPADLEEITLRVSRRGDAVEVRYAAGEAPAELAALVYMPPDCEVMAGIMCAAPEGSGFIVSFHDLRIAGREWGARQPGQPAAGWAGQPAPEWAGESPAAPPPDWDGQPGGNGTVDWFGVPAGETAQRWQDEPEGAGRMPAEWADEQPPEPSPAWPEPQASEPAGSPADEGAGDKLQLDWAQPLASDAVADWDLLSGSLTTKRGDDLADDQGKEPAADARKKAGGKKTGEPAGPPPEDDKTDPVLPAATSPAKPVPAARKRSVPKLPVPRKPAPPGEGGPADAADEWISLLTADPAEE
jgi:regulation of enolase protein 1 (concanavalin A-like superfamily)